jgi:mitogen-activated protein kinase kinase
MLLTHPWMKTMRKPQTITEEAEDGDETAAALAKLSVSPDTEDPEVAEWVKSVFERKTQGLEKEHTQKPALHTAPLDSASPVTSPMIGSELALS